MKIPFKKMHGLGNDFVVIDARNIANWSILPEKLIRKICDRKRGIGCDQLIIMEPAPDKNADIFMRIYNADGSEVSACGNASRCVALEIMIEKKSDHCVIQTKAGLLDCTRAGESMVSVDMGQAKLDWRDIPLKDACDTSAIPIEAGDLPKPVGVNMGNPHAVFFIDNVESFDVAKHGPGLERHPMFPERANIEFATVIDRNTIRMRVWERGAGITDACGTGACATLVASARKGLTGRSARIVLDGGSLDIEWLKDGHVLMTGPVATSFSGETDLSVL